ncbi:uncharacterized protein LOC124927348 isoform X2 [Impatiens glandulifera]|nr:uncharacterized protein LOC124927348 isoform X2 [Impatiens glandulifera]XP_047323727.1 uncharacterized protein LOC124927348 isoform X2 [Impatiens glandulifera]
MTVQVRTVNLLIETHGGARKKGETIWMSPMAAITMRNLSLYTTDANWNVVNLKEARDFSNNKKYIYLFKKLEWESLSIDLLPHPDMFAVADSRSGSNKKDDDGAKRMFFGGERFIEGISGQAHITVQRTELNSPLGLEVQLHIPEAVCPALSEPGLRAVLRFLTGLYICLNRGDVNPNDQRCATEAAGRSLVSIIVDHIFLRIKDAEFKIELLMQSLFFSRACVSDGESANYLTRVRIGGLFLSDTFSRPPCTLVEPSVQHVPGSFLQIPEFAKSFCPPIYPLDDQLGQLHDDVPLISLHSLRIQPSPVPPSISSQTTVDCQPLTIHLQEESCLRICSLLADGIVVNPGAVLPDFSVNTVMFFLKGLDVNVPLNVGTKHSSSNFDSSLGSSFAGARLRMEDVLLSESPFLKLNLLNLEKDPACFCLWNSQPVDASQKKWTAKASLITLSLDLSDQPSAVHSSKSPSSFLRCVELKDACTEVAMVTADGSPLINIPPPGGIVRVGVACKHYNSNTSIEQLFFVLDLCAYFGSVSEKIAVIGKQHSVPKNTTNVSVGESILEKVPSDTAVSLAVKGLQLRFLEFSSNDMQGLPLVQFVGEDLFVKVAHRTLGGAMAVSSVIKWNSIEVDCADTGGNSVYENGTILSSEGNDDVMTVNGHHQLRPVFWVHKNRNKTPTQPFLDIIMDHVIPFDASDIECHSLSLSACIAGIRLGGGMNYAEALLHRFGILGSDGGPGEGLSRGLERLSLSPLSKLFKASPMIANEPTRRNANDDSTDTDSGFLSLGAPDDVDVCIEFRDWLFALEGAQDTPRVIITEIEGSVREELCWHTTFRSLLVKANSSPKHVVDGKEKKSYRPKKYPIELITVGVEGLEILKPQALNLILEDGIPSGLKGSSETHGGINLEARVVISGEEGLIDNMSEWGVEHLRFSVHQPIEAVVTKDELQHLALLCTSEVDSMGRIVAGVLRVLKLEKSFGPAAITQLTNLGSESFDRIFTPKKVVTGWSPYSTVNGVSLHPSLESTVNSLEEMLYDSQAKCDALKEAESSSTQHLADIKQLSDKLENMQNVLARLRTQL